MGWREGTTVYSRKTEKVRGVLALFVAKNRLKSFVYENIASYVYINLSIFIKQNFNILEKMG